MKRRCSCCLQYGYEFLALKKVLTLAIGHFESNRNAKTGISEAKLLARLCYLEATPLPPSEQSTVPSRIDLVCLVVIRNLLAWFEPRHYSQLLQDGEPSFFSDLLRNLSIFQGEDGGA